VEFVNCGGAGYRTAGAGSVDTCIFGGGLRKGTTRFGPRSIPWVSHGVGRAVTGLRWCGRWHPHQCIYRVYMADA
jgi:hypothetical protein